ncbi:MAG: hypothetical protein ACI38Q_04825 [Candidatus Bruticola sp.]
MAHTPDLLASFRLSQEQLEETAKVLSERIESGLSKDGQEIEAIPAYLTPPPQGISGTVLVIDTGGTNVRAAVVKLNADGTHKLTAGPVHASIPAGRRGEPISAEEFFDMQASLALQLNPEANLPVGYCFSYPAQSTPEADARLIKWTKDVHITGVEGNLVGKMLLEALQRQGYKTSSVAVLNDTVAALLAGAGANAHNFEHYIGLIAGTGTNMAAFVPVSENNKLSRLPWNSKSMAVNLESGNFTPPYLNQFDDKLDRSLDIPGQHRYEKAVAGYYLPFIYAQANDDEEGNFDPYKGTAQLVELRDRQRDELAAAILDRSADLIAAGLAGLIRVLGSEGRVCITAEGSRYWADPALAPRVAKLLPSLISPKVTFSIIKVEDANLLGSAYAALNNAKNL